MSGEFRRAICGIVQNLEHWAWYNFLMPIIFSEHAKRQLKRRNISLKLAKDITVNPDKIASSFRNGKLRSRTVRGKLVEIVTRTEGSRITIITGYFIKK